MSVSQDDRPYPKQKTPALSASDIKVTRERDRRSFMRSLGVGIAAAAAVVVGSTARVRAADSDGGDYSSEPHHDEKSYADTDLPTTQDPKTGQTNDSDYTHNDRKADSD